MRSLAGVALAIFLSACGPFVPVTDVSKVDPDVMRAALQLRTYIVGLSPKEPFIVIEPIDAYSCKNQTWERPASKGDALKQLKLMAYKLGANAIMDVEFDTRGTDTWGTNCWQTVQASGVAIKVEKPK